MQEKGFIKWAEEKFAYLNSPVYNIFALNKNKIHCIKQPHRAILSLAHEGKNKFQFEYIHTQ